MKKGFWILTPGADYSIKKYKCRMNSYLLFREIEGPYYLINEKVLSLLKELHKPHTTLEIYEKMEKFSIDQNKGSEILGILEKIGIITYRHILPKKNSRLHFIESLPAVIPEKQFRFLLFFILTLFSLIFIHFIYLIITKFSLLMSVSYFPTIEDYLLLLLLSIIFTIFHEIAHCVVHYVSCGRFPKSIFLKPMGPIFLVPVPKVNLNVTYLIDSHMQRLAVLGAGLFMDLLLLWGSFLMVNITHQIPLWVYLTWFIFISFFFNLIPLWNSDGHYILSELICVPNLNFYARDALTRLIKRKGNYSIGLALYGASKLVFETTFFVLFLVIWYKLMCLIGAIGKYLFWGIFAVIFLIKFVKEFNKHRIRR